MLLPDAPITRADEDEIDVASFVKRLVRPLTEPSSGDSLVIGLYGPWGQGKSSALNLLHEALRNATEGVASITVRFNPWLYSDTDSLLLSFFGTLKAEIGGSELLPPEEREKLRTAIEGVARFVTPVLKVLPIPSLAATVVEGGLNGAARFLSGGEKNFHTRKQEVAEILQSFQERPRPLRVVVLIDDLDRANASEIRTVLRLVKLIADLPNVSYVLSMDDLRVREILGERTSDTYGSDYLEKIVQIAVYLPPVLPERLRVLVLEAAMIELVDANMDAREVVEHTYDGGLDYYGTLGRRIRTLRDRARFVNTLRFVLKTGTRKLDLNGRDLVLVSFLQTFFPDVFSAVRRERDFLLGYEASGYVSRDAEARRKEAEWRTARLRRIAGFEVAEGASPRERARLERDAETALRVLRVLFPQVELGVESDRNDKYRAENRIASPERFDLYFQLTPRAHEVPDDDVLAVLGGMRELAELSDRAEQSERLRLLFAPYGGLAHPDARESFFQKLMDRWGSVSSERNESLASALVDLEPEVGALWVVRMILELAKLTAAPRFTIDETFDGDYQTAGQMVCGLVDSLSDEFVAIDVANDHWKGIASVRFPQAVSQAIAAAGLARARAYFATHPDVFVEPPMRSLELVWNWHRLSTHTGNQGADVRAYLAELLATTPQRASDVLALCASWSNETPRFSVTSLEEAHAALRRLVDIDRFVEDSRRAEVQAGARYRSLLVEFLDDYDRRSSAKSQGTEDLPSAPTGESSQSASD